MPTTIMKDKSWTGRFSAEFLDTLKEVADYEKTTVSALIRKSLLVYLEQKSDQTVEYAKSLLSANKLFMGFLEDYEGEELQKWLRKWCDVWEIPYDPDEMIKAITRNYENVAKETETIDTYTKLSKKLRESS